MRKRNQYQLRLITILVAFLVFSSSACSLFDGKIFRENDFRLPSPDLTETIEPTSPQVQNILQRTQIPNLINTETPFAGETFYVSPIGYDSNPGTIDLPWKTIKHAAQMTFPGMVVVLRGGIYSEVVEVRNSGTPDQPIRFVAYPGEFPIIDGYGHLPSYWVGLFSIFGDWIQVSGLETRNSKYDGFGLYGNHDTVENVSTHDNFYRGILIKGNFGTVQNCHVWNNSLVNQFGVLEGNWSSGISSGNQDGITENALIRSNMVWDSWGEGISAFYSNGTIIEGNIIHDSYSTNIYISDSTNIRVEGNFVYMSHISPVYGYGANVGIMMGDEKYDPPSRGILIINNIAFHNKINFYWWQGNQKGGMMDTVIANNTFVNAIGTGNIKIQNGTHSNVIFANNIISQENNLPAVIMAKNNGIQFSNNVWSTKPAPAAAGSHDLIADPLFSKNGENPYLVTWYQLDPASPVIGAGTALPGVTVDFWGVSRSDFPPTAGALLFDANH